MMLVCGAQAEIQNENARIRHVAGIITRNPARSHGILLPTDARSDGVRGHGGMKHLRHLSRAQAEAARLRVHRSNDLSISTICFRTACQEKGAVSANVPCEQGQGGAGKSGAPARRGAWRVQKKKRTRLQITPLCEEGNGGTADKGARRPHLRRAHRGPLRPRAVTFVRARAL